MRRVRIVFTFVFAFLFLSVLPAQDEKQNVILISWDGLDRSIFKELLENKKLPNASMLIKEGGYIDLTMEGIKTSTKPGHASMLSGYLPDKTKVFSNRRFRPIPKGYTIFERLEKFFGKDNIATIMVTGKKKNLGARGPGYIKTKKGRRRKVKGEPFYNAKKVLDICDIANRGADKVGKLALKYLEKHKSERFFAFIHFSDPDHTGHRYGDSKQHRDAVIKCDKWLGRIVKWLKDNNLYETTTIYVTTDHGRDEGQRSHINAPDIWLFTNDNQIAAKEGHLVDIAPTILHKFGLNLSKIVPSLDGKLLLKKKARKKY